MGAGGHREVGEAAAKEITIIIRVARGRLLGFLISTSLAPWGGRGGLVVSPAILCLSDVGPHGSSCGAARDQRRVPEWTLDPRSEPYSCLVSRPQLPQQ